MKISKRKRLKPKRHYLGEAKKSRNLMLLVDRQKFTSWLLYDGKADGI